MIFPVGGRALTSRRSARKPDDGCASAEPPLLFRPDETGKLLMGRRNPHRSHRFYYSGCLDRPQFHGKGNMEEPAAVHETDQLLKPRDSWLGIEIRHFAALAAVASEHSFRGAAERLGYVQSAISRQIAYLEQATGSRLIERSQGPKPVRLTEAGELLLAHASAILGSLDAAQDDLAKVETSPVDEVRVGFSPGVAPRILPAALVAFGRRRPDVRVVARESGTDTPLYDLLRRGSIDLAFAHLPVQD